VQPNLATVKRVVYNRLWPPRKRWWAETRFVTARAACSAAGCPYHTRQLLVLMLLAGSCAPAEPVLPNPASVVCEQEGAGLDIRVEGGQSVVYCVFEDGSECEEWDFYYGRCARTAPEPSLPNPASVHCEEQGGTLDIRTDDTGAVGHCIFDDGSECEEWAFLRGECSPAAAQPGLPNPASVYCEEQGGTLDIRTDDAGAVGYCIFDDGSECEEWALYHGECFPAAAQPALPNPASVHCEEQGGTLDIRTDDAGAIGYCLFDDGSECEEWAFYRGDCSPAAAQPALPNPASVHCQEQGGAIDIRTEDAVEVSYCVFDDGSECEEWAFLRGECPAAEPPAVMINAATAFCEEQGGTVQVHGLSGRVTAFPVASFSLSPVLRAAIFGLPCRGHWAWKRCPEKPLSRIM